MWPFHKTQTLEESGFFRGFTDWHSHILPGVDDGVQTMEEALRILAAYERLGIKEVWLTDKLFEERLEQNDLLPIGMEGKHLLVETSYFNPPMGLQDILLRIKAKGYYPVLAHPERYLYMEDKDYRQLKSMDVRFQLNLLSLAGAYGKDARKKAQTLLKKGMYDYAGTDIHRYDRLEMLMDVRMKGNLAGRSPAMCQCADVPMC